MVATTPYKSPDGDTVAKKAKGRKLSIQQAIRDAQTIQVSVILPSDVIPLNVNKTQAKEIGKAIIELWDARWSYWDGDSFVGTQEGKMPEDYNSVSVWRYYPSQRFLQIN